MIISSKTIRTLRFGSAVILVCLCLQVEQVCCQTLVVTTTDEPLTTTTEVLPLLQAASLETEQQNTTENVNPIPPDVYSLKVRSDIIFRYATTLVTSRVANPNDKAREVTFRVTIPETAFISRFLMEIKGKVYEAYVKEKEKAKLEYAQAVQQGLTAAHVAYNPRDSNAFTVSVNVEKYGKVTFNLTYEELLNRRLNTYEHVINVDPGQIVPDLSVEVNIVDNNNITRLEVPVFKTTNEISSAQTDSENSWAVIERPSPKEARVKYTLTPEQQKEVGGVSGLAGQLAVRYDIEREQNGGEVMVVDGYFVHFFSPEGLTALKKHVVFILDTSGSMYGIKIKQLREAMDSILGELQTGDSFNIVEFNSRVYVWSPSDNGTARPDDFYPFPPSSTTTVAPQSEIEIFPATPENIMRAQEYINRTVASGGTNIHDAVKKGIELAGATRRRNSQSTNVDLPEPIIIFLTDGEPTVGLTGTEEIQAAISEANGHNQVAIFSLAFGQGADFRFLRRLSLANRGFARRIYEDADAVLQLKDFYKQVASPLLANVTFKYDDTKVDWGSLTKLVFPTFFAGSELVVAGKISCNNSCAFSGSVDALSSNGSLAYDIARPVLDYPCYTPFVQQSSTDEVPVPGASLTVIRRPCLPSFPLPPRNVTHKFGFLERLWAYLTIQQLLEEYDASGAKDHEDTNSLDEPTTVLSNLEEEIVPIPKEKTPREKALELALKYSFVTPVTSLVVVKPNSENDTETGLFSGSEPSTPVNAAFMSGGAGALGFAGPPGFAGFSALAAPAPISSFQGARPSYQYITTPHIPFLSTSFPSHLMSGGFAESDSVSDNGNITNALSDVKWLNDVRNGSGLLLPVGPNNTAVIVPLDENQMNGKGGQCTVPFINLPGFCRPLVYCVQSNFTEDVETFLKYYCNIEGYVGACCPELTMDDESETTGVPDTTIQARDFSEEPLVPLGREGLSGNPENSSTDVSVGEFTTIDSN